MDNNIYTAIKRRTNDRFIDDKCSYNKIVERLKTEQFRKLVLQVRRLDKAKQTDYKKDNSSGFHPSFYIDNDIKHHNGIIQIDIDLGDKYTTDYLLSLKERLRDDSRIFLMFWSATTGLKVMVKTSLCEMDTRLHRKAYYEVINLLGITGLRDNCGSQLARFCYFAFDENLHYNPDADIIDIDIERLKAEVIEEDKLEQRATDSDYRNKELLTAFDYISRLLPYNERREVNCAMFSVFGSAATPLLKAKWNKSNKRKLVRQIQADKDNKSHRFTAGTIFHYALSGGYKPGLHNRKISRTDRKPRYDYDDFVTLEVGERELVRLGDDFFDGVNNQFWAISQGLGKSHLVAGLSAENVDKNIDILLKSHEMADQYYEMFIDEMGEEWTKNNVVHIYGRQTKGNRFCPPEKTLFMDKLSIGSFCKEECDLRAEREYHKQFEGAHKIRLYTHNHLFQHSSILDRRKAEICIVDEDIINALSKNHISTDGLKDITQRLKAGEPLNQVIDDNFDLLAHNAERIKNNTENENVIAVSKLLAAHSRRILKNKDAAFPFQYSISKNDYLVIYNHHKVHKKYNDTKTLFMDGTGNERLVNKVLGNVEFHQIKVSKQQNVKVIQNAAETYSKTYMAKNYKMVLQQLKKDCKGYENIGLITYQNIDGLEDFYQYAAQAINAVKYGYFGNIRGSNAFEECDLLVILGRQHTSTAATEMMYKNLYTQNKPLEMKQAIASDVWAGQGYENNYYRFINDEQEEINQFLNNDETLQAIGRVRMIRKCEDKCVLIYNDLVLKDLQVDELRNTEGNVNSDYKKLLNFVNNNGFLVVGGSAAGRGGTGRKKYNTSFISEKCGIDAEILKYKADGFIEDVVGNADMVLEVLEVKHEGKEKKMKILRQADYKILETDLRPYYKGGRPVHII